jgi:prohibitin 2
MIGLIHLIVFCGALAVAAWGAVRFAKVRNPEYTEREVYFRAWKPNIPIAVAGLAAAFLYVVLVVPSIGTVPAGHRGVVLSFGAVTGRILESGIYVVNPFTGESVVMMNVQVVAGSVVAPAASRDLQDVAAKVTVNYNLEPAHTARVYDAYRKDFADRVLAPAIQEAVKAATAKFDAENLIRQRQQVKEEVERLLTLRMQPTHRLVALSITDFKFSPEFSNAIEAKVTATQQALKAQNDLERVRFESEQRVLRARAEAEAIRIQAQAVTSQGGADYVKLKAIEKWNGTVPTTMLGEAIPFVNVK